MHKKCDQSIGSIIVLHTSDRYITFVAMQNCIDYFMLVGLIGKAAKPVIKSGQELKVFIAFLNAIESLNNIVDYLYFDKFFGKTDLMQFKAKLCNEYIALKKINSIANAYKHCKRGRWENGKFKENFLEIFAKDIVYDHHILAEAFKFWRAYLNGEIEIPTNQFS